MQRNQAVAENQAFILLFFRAMKPVAFVGSGDKHITKHGYVHSKSQGGNGIPPLKLKSVVVCIHK